MTTPPQNPLRPLLQLGAVFESAALDPVFQPLLTPLGAKAQGPVAALDALLAGQSPEILKFPEGLPFLPPPLTGNLTSLTLVPLAFTLGIGDIRQLALTGNYSDGTARDLTNLPQVAWSSSDPSIVEVAPGGVVIGLNEGPASIAAVIGPIEAFADIAITGVTPLSVVTLVGLSITPESGSLAIGETQQLVAMGLYSDGSTGDLSSDPGIEWGSHSPGIATITSSGLLTAIGEGIVTVDALHTGMVDSSAWTIIGVPPPAPVSLPEVSLTDLHLSPSAFNLSIRQSQQLTAIGMYSDGFDRNITPQVTWSSANHLVATVSPSGLVTGLCQGTVLITGSLGVLTRSATVSVS